jgi:hypothetical protein
MRQDKPTGSLRRGGRCPKRQGGGGGGGVGTILSNVLKKRSCISRTAPRLLCTLEPGEERGCRWGSGKSRGAGAARALAAASLRLGGSPRLGARWLGRPGRHSAHKGRGGGTGLPRRREPAAYAPAFSMWWGGAGG